LNYKFIILLYNRIYNIMDDIYNLVFNNLVDSISLFLPIQNIHNIKLVNKNINNILNDEYFWKLKLYKDFNVPNKGKCNTFLERYILANSMGNILIFDFSNNPLVDYDIGEEVKFNISLNGVHRKLPYKAIKAINIRPNLYFVDDNYDLYFIGSHKEGFSDEVIYKTPFLLDRNVSHINGGPHHFFYIKEGDIYGYDNLGYIRKFTDVGNIIKMSYCYPTLLYITNSNDMYKLIYCDSIDEVITKFVSHNVMDTHIYSNTIFYLDMKGNINTNTNIKLKLKEKVVCCHGQGLWVTESGKYLKITPKYKKINWDEDGGVDIQLIDFTINEVFVDIENIVGCSLDAIDSVLTKNGDVYMYDIEDSIVKLDIKAKNICYSPDNLILII
ncbi:F-box domain-containing protein, partial [Orpheovirus IHUMI-LCC2]